MYILHHTTNNSANFDHAAVNLKWIYANLTLHALISSTVLTTHIVHNYIHSDAAILSYECILSHIHVSNVINTKFVMFLLLYSKTAGLIFIEI